MISKNGIQVEQAIHSVGEGWTSLVESIYKYIDKFKTTVAVVCVKEKFGTLRFYYDVQTLQLGENESSDVEIPYFEEELEDIENYVRMAEIKSGTICEACGADGSIRNERPWVRTLCTACFKEGV
jgi:hypothetical protein